MKRLLLAALTVTLFVGCNSSDASQAIDSTADSSATKEVSNESGQETRNDFKTRFDAFLNGFYDLDLPIYCSSFTGLKAKALPDFDILDEFVVTGENEGINLPGEVPHEWWTDEDGWNQFRLLGKIELPNYYIVFVDYEWDSGYSMYSGVFYMTYSKEGEFIELGDLCSDADIEKTGMIGSSVSKGTINKDLTFREVYHTGWQDNSEDDLGEINFTATVMKYEFDESGHAIRLSIEEFEGEEAKSIELE